MPRRARCRVRVISAGVARQQKAGPAWQREHPLAHRNAGQHAIDHVCGSALHPSCRAGRTDPAALAGERNEQLVAARDATDASESVGENAAAQVPLELGHDEAGQPAPTLLHLRQEGLEVPPNRLVQERLLRLSVAVVRDSGDGSPSFLPSGLRRSCLGAARALAAFHEAGQAWLARGAEVLVAQE
jgi:hypothetical protein